MHAKINILLYHNFYFQNPNTRYEANFIPIFTLSDWNLSENDAPKVENGLLTEYKNKHSLRASKVSYVARGSDGFAEMEVEVEKKVEKFGIMHSNPKLEKFWRNLEGRRESPQMQKILAKMHSNSKPWVGFPLAGYLPRCGKYT